MLCIEAACCSAAAAVSSVDAELFSATVAIASISLMIRMHEYLV